MVRLHLDDRQWGKIEAVLAAERGAGRPAKANRSFVEAVLRWRRTGVPCIVAVNAGLGGSTVRARVALVTAGGFGFLGFGFLTGGTCTAAERAQGGAHRGLRLADARHRRQLGGGTKPSRAWWRGPLRCAASGPRTMAYR